MHYLVEEKHLSRNLQTNISYRLQNTLTVAMASKLDQITFTVWARSISNIVKVLKKDLSS